MFLISSGVVWAQKTCSPVTPGVSQNCLVTITVTPGVADVTHPQADSFKIRRSDASGVKTEIGTAQLGTPTIQNSFTDAGNVAHCYDAISVKAGLPDSAASPEQCWTTPALAPVTVTTPQGLTLSAISSQTIRISWADTNDPPNNETATEIQGKRATGQPYSLIATVGPDVTTWDYTGLLRYKTYCARIRAINGNVSSNYSAPSCATTSR